MEIYKNKSITLVDDYEVKISNQLQMMAEDELRETEEIRSNAITALRDWAERNPRINKIRLDSKFLLRFLRHKKFSIPMAQDSIEKYLLLRKYHQEDIYPFQNLDIKIPSILKLIDEGYIIVLPKRDALGRRLVFYRLGVFKPSVFLNHELLKLHGIVYETLLEDEENQIRGCVHIADSTGFGFNYLTLFTPKEAVRIAKNAEILLPMRHKEFHGINVPSSLTRRAFSLQYLAYNGCMPDMGETYTARQGKRFGRDIEIEIFNAHWVKYVLDFGLGLMSEKLRSRVQLYSKFEEMKNIDKDLLPLEYGGKIPMKEMIALFKLELEANQHILLKHDEMHVNTEMYPPRLLEGSVRAVKSPIEVQLSKPQKESLCGIQGSFRKLEID